ncbi:MAG: sigma-70 family RNA polymerase sigma factor [Lachnospiraceae bacterium]|nr:sigma-70 family RNA polymerase sigma factor [Lachnospiraceae bacterium]
MDDGKIIELFWAREESALAECQAKYGPLLGRIAFQILANYQDSEECVNDTYVRAWNTIPPTKPESLTAYLGRIVRNLAINRWQERRTAKRGGGAGVLLSELSECVPSPRTVEAEIDAKLLTNHISDWLNSLDTDDRVLFLRRYWFGDALKDLAAECRTAPNQLAGRLYRLRGKLREWLERENVTI